MSLISSPKLIIFDCDGVLVDSEPMSIGALKDLFSEHNLELTYEEVASRFKGRSLIDTRHSLRTLFNIELRDEAVDRMHQGLLEKFKTPVSSVFFFWSNTIFFPVCHLEIIVFIKFGGS